MPKVTFKDFMHERFVSKHLWNNPDAKRIFDILNEDASIKKAIELSEAGKPALLASIDKIEDFFEERGENSTFRLDEPLNCQLVGRMQRLILAAEGYKSAANKPMDTLYFRSAMTYKKS